MSILLAPSERSTSSSSGSVVAIPVATFTDIGKNATRNAVMIAGGVPIPNHSTSTGTTATFGMELNPINSGLIDLYNSGDAPTATPSNTPKTTAMPKPASVVINVCSAFGQMPGQASIIAVMDSDGVGSRKVGTLNTRHPISHTRKKASVVIHGLALKSARRQFIAVLSRR